MGRQLGNIGGLYLQLSDYPKALDYLVKARNIAEELGNALDVGVFEANIGIVYSNLSDHVSALQYYSKALKIVEATGYKAGVATHLNNIGLSHFHLHDFTTALEYLEKAQRLAEELGQKDVIATCLGAIGEVYEKMLDFDKALDYYSRGMHLHEELGQISEVADAKSCIGELYLNEEWSGRDETLAEEFLMAALEVRKALGTSRYETHKVLAMLYKTQQRWEEYSFHYEKYHEQEKEEHSEEARKSVVLMEQRKLDAEREKQLIAERSEATATQKVLHQVLPPSIADRLVKGEKVADYFQNASILFADIVGFTPIASRMPAKAVLAFLNYVFGEFDRIMERNGCEKIKTIGDGYLAVAGAPLPCDDHAERIARAAIELMGDIILPEEIRTTLPKGSQFSLRIGIHTGPCFGGIVGENRFVYDIYSDAVNLAARMESHGEPGKIHVSDEFCFHLQNRMDATGDNLGGIRFVEREEIEIKGKGLMRTYFLEKA